MTRRLVLSMLATVFAILIAAGVTAYLTTRSVLLANMDAAMVERTAPVNESDRFVARNELGQKVESGTPGDREKYKPSLQWAKFVTLDDGIRVRTVSVHTFVRKDDGAMEPVTATLSEPAAPFDRLMNRLAWALALAGCAGAAIAGVVARLVARIALRPLKSTAATIGEIDERNLSRRIDSDRLRRSWFRLLIGSMRCSPGSRPAPIIESDSSPMRRTNCARRWQRWSRRWRSRFAGCAMPSRTGRRWRCADPMPGCCERWWMR